MFQRLFPIRKKILKIWKDKVRTTNSLSKARRKKRSGKKRKFVRNSIFAVLIFFGSLRSAYSIPNNFDSDNAFIERIENEDKFESSDYETDSDTSDDIDENSVENENNYQKINNDKYYDDDKFSNLDKLITKVRKMIEKSQIQASYHDYNNNFFKDSRRDLFKIENPHKYKFLTLGSDIPKFKLRPVKVEKYYDFETFYRVKQAIDQDFLNKNAISYNFKTKEQSYLNPIINSLIESLTAKTVEKVDIAIEKIIEKSNNTLFNKISEIIEISLENKSVKSPEFQAYWENKQTQDLKNSIMNKTKVRTIDLNKDLRPSIKIDSKPSRIRELKSVRSTVTDPKALGKNPLVFSTDVNNYRMDFTINYSQVKKKWYHYPAYLQYGCRTPSFLYGSNNDKANIDIRKNANVDQLTALEKKEYRKQLTTDDVNSIRYAIKNFCQHGDTEILFPSTFNQNRRRRDINNNIKNNKTKVAEIFNGTLFINRKERTFVFFDKESNSHNIYRSGWKCFDTKEGNESWYGIISDHNVD